MKQNCEDNKIIIGNFWVIFYGNRVCLCVCGADHVCLLKRQQTEVSLAETSTSLNLIEQISLVPGRDFRALLQIVEPELSSQKVKRRKREQERKKTC